MKLGSIKTKINRQLMQTGEDTKLTELKESINFRDISNFLKGKGIYITILK